MYDIPLITDQTDVAIATKTAGGLKALRDGSANMYGGSGNLNTVAGTVNGITLTTDPASPPHTTYKNGHRITILPGSTNTSGMTITLDGLVGKAILKWEAGALVALVAGDIVLNIEALLLFSTQSDAWILEGNLKVALLNAPNLHTADIAVKTTAGTVQRRTHLDPRAGNENQIWDGVNIWHNGTIWKFDDDTKPAFLQIFDVIGNEIGYYHAPANPGFDPVPVKITAFDSAGKMTGGIVPLARVGFSSNFTTPLISSGTALPITISHGLGTDEVQVILRGVNFISSQENQWATVLMLPNATTLFTAGSGNINLVAKPTVPTSGNINLLVYNSGSIPAQIVIYYNVLRRN